MENNEQAWGKLLKYYRQKKKQKQDDIAFGICTPSYLSRIENGIVVAEHSMYEQLFKNLGIDFNTLKQQLKSQTTFWSSYTKNYCQMPSLLLVKSNN